MRIHLPCTALGLALVAAAPVANAQTVITRQIVDRPVETVRTVTTTTRTVRPVTRRRVVTTTRRTVVRERIIPTERTVISSAPAPYPRAVYDVVTPAPAPAVTYDRQPLYDTVVETPDPAAVAPVAFGAAVPAYRYVYETDRILVIDPTTNIVVQALPR